MLERFSIVVFSAKNDGGVHFHEKYDLGAIQGSKYPKNGNFEKTETENDVLECARVAERLSPTGSSQKGLVSKGGS